MRVKSARIPWKTALVTGRPAPADALDPAAVAPDAWVRIVPYAFGAFDKLEAASPYVPPSKTAPPQPFVFTVDRKCVAPLSFYCYTPNIVCSEPVLRALEALGCQGWTAAPVAHGSPHPVRGHALYDLQIPGLIGPPSPASFRKKKKTPYGLAGSPIPPVTLVGSSWSGDPLCLTDWLEADTISPYRAIIARGDFIHALSEATGGKPAVVLQPVTVQGLKKPRAGSKKAPEWTPAPAPWKRPTRWKGSVLDRIRSTAKQYKHTLPGPAGERELRRVFERLEGQLGCRFDPLLERLLLSSNGPSLFDGALTFFSIGKRTKANAVPAHDHSVAPDDLVQANDRVSETDWMVTRAPGSVLFAARYAEMHAMWALTAEGRVRLLPQSGDILGPDLPFETWLEDQVADLEWATENPEALGRWRYTWLPG
jgi:hypothetical protein